MSLAGADGVFHDDERKWIIGKAAVVGASKEVLDELQAYQPGLSDSKVKIFDADMNHPAIKSTMLMLIYDGFCAIDADNHMDPKEVEAVYALAIQ
ncbi:unnamed protein product, partial [Rotaria sordida]